MHKRVRYNWLLAILVVGLLWPGIVSAQSGGPGQPMVHIVQRGDTLFSVARQCGTTVDAITYASGISDPRRLYVGQRLVIPGAVAAPAAWSFHWVRPGETLKGISSQYGLAWRTVALANQMVNPLLLSAGQVLQLPVEEEAFFGGALHTVQPGEMLSQIAFHYDLSLWELMEANGVANPALVVPGQLLRIPGERPDWMPSPFEEIVLDPLPVRQGEILWLQVRTEEPVTLSGSLFDRPLQFAEEEGAYYALAGVYALIDPGMYELTLTAVNAAGEAAAVSFGLVVEDGEYGRERIDVPAGRSDLLDRTVQLAEEQRLEEMRYLFTPERMWEAPFSRPVEAAISSYFGTRRSYNGGPYSSYHTGVDYNAGGGTPVLAPAAGVVVLAEPLAVRGNVVVVDHGWGVLTGYWHLSTIDVVVGQSVQAGDMLGRVGNTGLSTGSHLHWEVWVGGVSVDGRQWLTTVFPPAGAESGAGP